MEKVYESEDDNPSRCTRQGVLLRILIGAFAVITVLLIIIALVLILTQKPISLGSSILSDNFTSSEKLDEYHRRRSNYKQFKFEQLFSGKLFLKDSYDYAWLRDGSLLRKKDEFLGTSSDVLRTPPDSFESDKFLDDYDLMRTLSADMKYAYRARTIRQVFRYSLERVFEIVKIVNGTSNKMSWTVGLTENATIQAFYWNPDASSHDFIYVHNFNVYYQMDPEKPEDAVQLTTDGEYFNRYGVPNWLYEEEILDDSKAVWWSPSGRYVSYLRFDDRKVNRIFLPTYAENDPYVEYFELPYPKAGVEQNTIVSQFVWDRLNNRVVEAVAPDELRALNDTYYIVQNTWMKISDKLKELGEERLVTVWTNREQNQVFYTLCNEDDCIMTYSQTFALNNKEMWAEPREIGSIYPAGLGFFTILPRVYRNNVYNHVAFIEIDASGTGKVSKWIGEDYDVISILGYWNDEDILTISGHGFNEIGAKNIYKIKNAANKNQSDEKIEKINSMIDDCEHGSYSVNPTGHRAIMLCHKPFENTKFYLINIDKPSEKVLLEGGDDAFLPFDKPNIEYGSLVLPSGIDAHYSIMTPPKITSGVKLPLIVDLYGGPNSRKVQKSTPPAHFIQICSQFEVVVVNVDVSGSSGRGWNVKEPVYKKLGQAEAQDSLDAIRLIMNKYKFINEKSISIMGWSYGGFLTSQMAIRDNGNLIKCAISIAPVTDFRYYDTAYTERYMGIPSENDIGYDKTNLIPNAKNMTKVKYFLAHGEKDDNVHYQNSGRWSEALQLENIHFTQLVYANEAHNLQGKLQHLYSEVQLFLSKECFEMSVE